MNVEKTWLYTFAMFLLEGVYRIIFRLEVRGAEHFPKNQNCILFANHISAWDPLTVAFIYRHNEIHFFAKDSLFKNKFFAMILRKLHAFPVRRGETDLKAMRVAMQVLKDGHVLGIFPEGHRTYDGELKPIETGIAVMALKSRVPVIPILIRGKYRPFAKVSAHVGEAIQLDDLWNSPADTEALDVVKSRFMHALRNLDLASNN